MAMKTYRLLKDVTDRGILRPAGTTIEYDDAVAQWAAAQGIIGPDMFRPPKKESAAPASTLRNGGVETPVHRVYESKD